MSYRDSGHWSNSAPREDSRLRYNDQRGDSSRGSMSGNYNGNQSGTYNNENYNESERAGNMGQWGASNDQNSGSQAVGNWDQNQGYNANQAPPSGGQMYQQQQGQNQMGIDGFTTAQTEQIAAKILTAVLQSNIVGNMAAAQPSGPMYGGNESMGNQMNQQRPNEFRGNEMSRGYGDRRYAPARRSPSPRSRFSRDRVARRFSPPRSRISRRSPPPRRRSPPPRFRGNFGSRGALSSRGDIKRRRSTSRDREESKRRRAASAELSSRGKSSEAVKTEIRALSPEKPDVPVEALYCHMCKHKSFTSQKTYLYHLEGIRHKKAAIAFYAKCDATLEYLRQNANLAVIRFGGMDTSLEPSTCSSCNCIVREQFFKHRKLLEHKMVNRYLRPKCCSKVFGSRKLMYEHKLSLPHLQRVYEENQKKDLIVDGPRGGGVVKWSFDDAVKYLKSRDPEKGDETNLENLAAFDGNAFVGIDFLIPRDSVLCKACDELVPIGLKSLESHMLSSDHYDNVIEYLRKVNRYEKIAGAADSKSEPKKRDSDTRRDHESDSEEEEDDSVPQAVQVIDVTDDGEEATIGELERAYSDDANEIKEHAEDDEVDDLQRFMLKVEDDDEKQ